MNVSVDRLPSAVKKLPPHCHKIYIYLRLRKSTQEIARLLSISEADVGEKKEMVRHVLAAEGMTDLIEDTRFVSIHADDPDVPELPITSAELAINKKLIINEFMAHLRDVVDSLPRHQLQLLRLRYKHHMPAKDILGFCRKVGFSIIPDKDIRELKEQDIFYALNVALKEVLKRLKLRYNEEKSIGLENLKYVFEEIGV
jgi:hypothetical protein